MRISWKKFAEERFAKRENPHLLVSSLLVPPTTPPICGYIYINRYILDTKETNVVTFGLQYMPQPEREKET